MLYETLRASARIALRWYYADVIIQGRERVPPTGPVLIVANHPNALVDALVVGTSLDRRVLLTAKATLFENPLFAKLLHAVGVVPLRRAKDEAAASQPGVEVSRNAQAFELVSAALCRNGVVLVFPEGISHDAPTLAPLRTGAARMAVAALDAGAHDVSILPFGLVFEEKERPRSRVLVRIGEPLHVGAWREENPSADASTLTEEIDARLRMVTLNFATAERAQRAVRVAAALAAIDGEPASLGSSRFANEADIAHRVEAATEALENAPAPYTQAADDLVTRLDRLESRLAVRGATLTDVRTSVQAHQGAWFALREGAIMLVGFPIALLGRITHWLPIHFARTLAMRPLRTDASRDQPAMRTIVLGLLVLLVWYGAQAVIVAAWLGFVAAILWIAGIFVAAQVDLLLDDRFQRARHRARTFLALRSDPSFRADALAEIDALLADALELERALVKTP